MKRKFCYKFLIITFLIFLSLNLESCKSHKKQQKEDMIDIPAVSVKNNKKDKNSKEIGDLIAEEAITWVGTPYKYGGSEKGRGTDCSGLVMMVYSEIADIKMPRNSAKQAEYCEELKESKVKAGDLIFFAIGNNKNEISHVGVMIDKIRFVHASSSKGVIISDLETPYYQRNFKKYGRVPR